MALIVALQIAKSTNTTNVFSINFFNFYLYGELAKFIRFLNTKIFKLKPINSMKYIPKRMKIGVV